ncbi:MAG: heterodisulfide reductase subunit F [Kiritimatiellaeota bacterium]|nr:heterodisulfide reductase subunit F [Kiritimatiellota bacterium]
MDVDYVPYRMRIDKVTAETPDVKTFKLVFENEEQGEAFTFKAGQFGLYSIFGYGEATFCVASSPTRKGYIECSIKCAGRVTQAFHQLNEGDIVGFRGPYGNCFPVEEMKGKNVVFVGGGIGLAPVRSVIWNVLDRREEFGDITICYGARTVADLVYKDELKQWDARDDVKTIFTVDPGGETPDWTGQVGFVPTVLGEADIPAENTVCVLCGPPIMIKFSLPVLTATHGLSKENVFTTLENRMKCGIGKCGRCNVGNLYVCKDGPVFRCSQLEELPPEF